ncbi:UNVERIFIED_CONTAM: protein FATTY ACID EXPORT 1, chloroplastic [Sesamum calycinum]|uniref:Protein FATTY ACID EXPORT 1, chloroplastic n=1 Tax=Sesamum calycinum TaxID=2727403 RepID=A0AAW2RVK9_9LAMI
MSRATPVAHDDGGRWRRPRLLWTTALRSPAPSPRGEEDAVLNVMSSDGRGTEVSNLVDKATPSYVEDSSKSQNGSSTKSDPLTQGFVVGDSNGRIQEQVNSQPKRAAKIHDFCFGIPFGGLVLSGGLLGFILSRNPVALSTGVLFGGALLALSTFSLKVWRQGKSSLPFILGQADQLTHLLEIVKLQPSSSFRRRSAGYESKNGEVITSPWHDHPVDF